MDCPESALIEYYEIRLLFVVKVYFKYIWTDQDEMPEKEKLR